MKDWLNQALATAATELNDAADPNAAARVVVRLGVAALLGGLLGWERERAGKAAGLRTHMLVSMGAALFVLGAEQAGIEPADNSRVLQGVTAGVGFLGAGTILKQDHANNVRGLTTAAGIWFTAAIGVTAGMGEEIMAMLSAALGLLVLWAIPLAHQSVASEAPAPSNPPPHRSPAMPQKTQHATIQGEVTYREGDGMPMPIRKGPVELLYAADSVTLSWQENNGAAGLAALPRDEFERYVREGLIALKT